MTSRKELGGGSDYILNGVRNPVDDMELCENILEDLLAGGLEAVISH